MVCVVDMDGDGAHVHRHTKGGNLYTKTNISYAPSINSISQMIKATVELLEIKGKYKGKDFKVLHRTWVMFQLFPFHQNLKRS